MPLTEDVEFLARLQKFNRVQIPVEVRCRYKLERGEILKAEVRLAGGAGFERFFARLLGDGRLTVPWEVILKLEADKQRYLLAVRLKPK